MHSAHTTFRKGSESLYSNTINISGEKESTFSLDDFFNDLHFFFKLSSARREDYASLENVTNIVAQYSKKHVETRWLSKKYVALRLLEQWPNLKKYFLNFLPNQSNFKSEIAKTYLHITIKKTLEKPLTEAYVSFVLLFHTILRFFFYVCKQESLWSISCFVLCVNYGMTFNQNLSRKKIIL